MYCPKCSQQQVSEEVRFCSRCGFLLTGVAEVLKNDGIVPGASVPAKNKFSTPRKQGIKQGAFALILLILTLPLLLAVGKSLEIHPAPLFMLTFILFISCLIRMIYAVMFQSNEPPQPRSPQVIDERRQAGSLPPAQSDQLSDFISRVPGKWRDSNELVFSNVNDVTTNQLDEKQ